MDAISGLRFASRGLLFGQSRKAPGELVWRGGETGFDWVGGNVATVVVIARPVIYPYFRKSTLPDLAVKAGFAFEAKGDSSLDELHGFFDGHFVLDSQKEM